MSTRDAWRWTDEHGVQRLVSTEELREALASGVIAGSTLVWRQGMGAWTPAFSVPEFAGAVLDGRIARSKATADDTSADTPTETDVLELLGDVVVEAADERAAPPAVRPAAGEKRPGPPARGPGGPSRPRAPAYVPAKRDAMRTLTGLDAPAADRPVVAEAPIVVPTSGGPVDTSGLRAITQAPGFGGAAHQVGGVAIPRAPKLPAADADTTTEMRGSIPDVPDQDAGDDEMETLIAVDKRGGAPAKDAKPAVGALRPPAGRSAPPPPPQRVAGRSVPPPPKPVAAPALRSPGPAAAKPGEAAAKPGDAAARPGEAGAKPGAPRAGRSVPPPPVQVRAPAALAKSPDPGRAAPARTAQATPGAAAKPQDKTAAAQDKTAAAQDKTAAAQDKTAAAPGGAAKAPAAAAAGVAQFAPKPEASARAADAPAKRDARSEPPAARPDGAASPEARRPQGAPIPASPPVPTLATDRAASAAASAPASASASAAAPAPASAAAPTPAAAPASAAAPADTPPPAAPGGPSDFAGAFPHSPSATAQPGAFGLPPPRSPRALEASADAEPRAPSITAGTTASIAGWIPRGTRPDPRMLATQIQVPLSSLLGAGGALICMVIVSFFVGRCSVGGPRATGVTTARPALADAPDKAKAALPAPPRPCWVARQPRRWAPLVSKSIPFEVVASAGGALAIGYARDTLDAAGVEVNPATGEVAEKFSQKAAATIARVSPMPGGETRFVITTEEPSALRSIVYVPAPSPFVVGLADGAVAAADRPDAAASPLWQVAGAEGLEAPRATVAEGHGVALTFRREKAIWGGWIGADRKPRGELTKVSGSGGAVGKPSSGWNGREVAVVFADRPAGSSRWEIRAGHAAPGAFPAATQIIPLPAGGPGGDAFAPDIAGLADGRWLLVWTEGPPGNRAMRAQTLGPDFSPVGDPIALSPPAGNFGQGILGVSGSYVGAVFLSKPAASYELWGVILQCG